MIFRVTRVTIYGGKGLAVDVSLPPNSFGGCNTI